MVHVVLPLFLFPFFFSMRRKTFPRPHPFTILAPPLSSLAYLAYGIRDLRIQQRELCKYKLIIISFLFATPETSACSEYQVSKLQIIITSLR